jgi:Uma2 family endonuclease
MSSVLEKQNFETMVVRSPMRKFTHEDYERMCRDGYFHPDERTELIHGEIRIMLAIGAAHIFATSELNFLLESQLPRDRFGVFSQSTLRIEKSSPDPDIYVTKGSKRNFEKNLANSKNVCLIIEVADSSLAFDRGEKLALYAAAAIPVYWIVNLVDRQVEVYTEPTGDLTSASRYATRQIYKDGQSVTFENEGSSAVIKVDDILVRLG